MKYIVWLNLFNLDHLIESMVKQNKALKVSLFNSKEYYTPKIGNESWYFKLVLNKLHFFRTLMVLSPTRNYLRRIDEYWGYLLFE